jgi:hypothetical protein
MALAAVAGPGPAAGPLRLGLGRLLGERGGLALAGPAGLVELLPQALDLGLQLGDAAVPLATGQADVSIHPHQDS